MLTLAAFGKGAVLPGRLRIVAGWRGRPPRLIVEAPCPVCGTRTGHSVEFPAGAIPPLDGVWLVEFTPAGCPMRADRPMVRLDPARPRHRRGVPADAGGPPPRAGPPGGLGGDADPDPGAGEAAGGAGNGLRVIAGVGATVLRPSRAPPARSIGRSSIINANGVNCIMAWADRGGRSFEYRSIRRDGRVTSCYVGGGGISAETAAYFRRIVERGRLDRQAERERWASERDRLVAAEREIEDADRAYAEVAEVAMVAAGFHRPKRDRWRRRRAMSSVEASEMTEAGEPLMTAAEMAGLLDRLDRAEGEDGLRLRQHVHEGAQILKRWAMRGVTGALPALRTLMARRPGYFGNLDFGHQAARALVDSAVAAGDVLHRDVFTRQIEALRDELAGAEPSPLERILAERVALAWFDAHHRDIVAVDGEGSDRGCTLDRAEFLSRQRSRATARFLAAAKALATVRRLAVPALKVYLSDPAGAGLEAGGPAFDPTAGRRLPVGVGPN